MSNFAGKVVLVTGGARGIGEAIARRFATEGAQVVIADLPTSAGKETAERLNALVAEGNDQAKAAVHFIPLDQGDTESISTAMNTLLEQHGRLDIVVNNAALMKGGAPFLEQRLDLWQQILNVNLTGVFLISQIAAKHMVEHGIKGKIINIASVNALGAQRGSSAYASSKGGVHMLTKAMSIDLAPYGIAVNAVAPGAIVTEQTRVEHETEPLRTGLEKHIPLGRPGETDEIAGAVIFLASNDSSYVSGQMIVVDGGYLNYIHFN